MAAKAIDSSCPSSKRKADDGTYHLDSWRRHRLACSRGKRAGSENDEQSELMLKLDLDALLSAPMDDNLRVVISTAMTEKYMNYLLNDEPLPWTSTMEVVDGSGGGDESIHAMNEP